jgi:hypothetical protein
MLRLTARAAVTGVLTVITLLAACPPSPAETLRWSGECAGFRLSWTDGDIQVRRVSGTGDVVLSCKQELLALTADEPQASLEATLEPISWVGPVLTVKVTSYVNVPLTAHPSMQTYYRTVDLRQPARTASLTDWVAEPTVRSTLLADPLVAKALKDVGGKPPVSVAELGKRLGQWSGDCQYGFTTDFADHFAFYDRQGDKVVLRIGLSHGCEAARGLFTLLGIELPVSTALQSHLQAAASGKAGFLAVNRPGRQRIAPAQVRKEPPVSP